MLDPWLPWLQEFSSSVAVLILIPGVIWLCTKIRFNWGEWRRICGYHFVGFVLFAMAHLALLGLFRSISYPLAGLTFEAPVSGWFLEFVYESRKDFLIYMLIIGLTYTYHFILDRLQGEANFVSEQNSPRYERQFLVKMLRQEYLVTVQDIRWIESARNYVLLHCAERAYPMRSTMQSLEDRLDPAHFARCHRTAMVKLSAIATLHQSPEPLVELTSGERIPLSKTYLPVLKSALKS